MIRETRACMIPLMTLIFVLWSCADHQCNRVNCLVEGTTLAHQKQ
jgi:hypothetical protein